MPPPARSLPLLYVRHHARRAVLHSSTSCRRSRNLQSLGFSSSSNSSSGGSSPDPPSPTKKRPRPTPAGTFVWRDVPYYHPTQGQGQQDPKHCLDVYVAAAPFPRAPQPVMVFVHGGLWVRGVRV